MKLKVILSFGALALALSLGVVAAPRYLQASDHDDGETDTKGRNQNLTDLFVFREKDQDASASASDLVFVMNTNPRSLPQQQYYFSTNSMYEFNVTRVVDRNATPTGQANIILRFEFSAPNASGQQQIELTTIRDGVATVAPPMLTTPIAAASTPTVNQVSVAESTLSVFAGLREDPFFFDVTQFFKVRAGLAGLGPAVLFRPPSTAVDFTKDYNVNTIVVRVPLSFIQGGEVATPSGPVTPTTFDVWETISTRTPQGIQQVERLARPAINEGLIITNSFLNTLNAVGPDFEAAALANASSPQGQAAAPIVAEAVRTLKALGNNDAEANALIQAFLPDVMRIDTTQPSTYAPTIGANCLNTKGSPVCGRKLKDDVIDTTLFVLTKGAIKDAVFNANTSGDNVSYEGSSGNPSQGHKELAPSFPYLALPY